MGASPNIGVILNFEAAEGRFISEIEDRRHMYVAFIGKDLKDKFFPAGDATGQSNFDSLLHSFPGPAYVMSLIDCDPQAALSAALLSVHDGVKAPELRQATPDPWELDLTAGQYDVSATFPGPPYHNKSFKQLMQPPHTPCTLDVQ